MLPVMANYAMGAFKNRDGSINWKLIGLIALGVAVVASVMAYRQEKAVESVPLLPKEQ